MATAAANRLAGSRGSLPAADRARLADVDRLVRAGRLGEADALLRPVVQRHPESFDAMRGLASLALAVGRLDDGIALLRSALRMEPDHGDVLLDLAGALHRAGEVDSAMACVDMATELDGADDAIRLRAGSWLVDNDCIAAATRVLAPMRTGVAGLPPQPHRAGRAALVLGDQTEALRCFESAARSTPRDAAILIDLGTALTLAHRDEEAVDAFDRALALDGGDIRAHVGLGRALAQAERSAEAMDAFRRALGLDAGDPAAVRGFAELLRRLGQDEDAALAYERLLALEPEGDLTRGRLLDCKMALCDWLNLEPLAQAIERALDAGSAAATASDLLSTCRSSALLQAAAKASAIARQPRGAGRTQPRPDRSRIRVGYLGPDRIGARWLEAHDQSRFEALHFGGASTADLADAVIAADLDILVNLDVAVERHAALFRRVASPIRVNLAFPGTLGTGWFDYLVADRTVVPPDDERWYDEALVRLPGCHLPPVDHRSERAERPARGLPAEGFVFACVGPFRRVTPEVFDAWLRLLRRSSDAVLWLPPAGEAVVANLVARAARSGVAAERFVFASPASEAEAEARRPLALADLALDTWPCNAGAEGAEALAAGAPMVSCSSETFGGRVGASLLHAVGLERLATGSLREYEALAHRLASTPSELSETRTHLRSHGNVAAWLDAKRYVQGLERAWAAIAAQTCRGARPSTFDVSPDA